MRLARKRQLACEGATRRVPLPVVANKAISLGEYRFVTQRSKPVGAGTMVNQDDIFTRADRLVLQFDVAEHYSMHRRHAPSVVSGCSESAAEFEIYVQEKSS